MTQILCWHLLVSTCVASGWLGFMYAFRDRGAATRHAFLLAATFTFAVPVQLLVRLGALVRGLLPVMPEHATGHIPTPMLTLVAQPSSANPHLQVWVFVFEAIWFAGAICLVFVWGRAFLQTPTSSTEACGEELALLAEARARLRYRGGVQLLRTNSDSGPCLTGLWRAAILLPENLSGTLSKEERLAILLHELSHAKRRDNLVRACGHALTCLFWFHPMLWWLTKRLDAEAELACDEAVLLAGVEPNVYLDSILKVCQCHFVQPLPQSSYIGTVSLRDRMEHIMTFATPSCKNSLAKTCFWLLLAVGLATSTAVGFATAPPGRVAAGSGTVCVIADRTFAQGTVVHPQGTDMRKRRSLLRCGLEEGRSRWFAVDEKAIGEEQIIEVERPKPVTACRQTAPKGKLCTCSDLEFSPGAVVGSANGRLVCPASGGHWQPYTGQNAVWPPVAVSQ